MLKNIYNMYNYEWFVTVAFRGSQKYTQSLLPMDTVHDSSQSKAYFSRAQRLTSMETLYIIYAVVYLHFHYINFCDRIRCMSTYSPSFDILLQIQAFYDAETQTCTPVHSPWQVHPFNLPSVQ
jgi:hypothetical protein